MPPRRSYAAGLSRRKHDKVDNHEDALPLKVALREEALAAVSAPRVLDLFAGRGGMWSNVWRRSDRYLGTDKELSQVLAHPMACHHADAQTVLRATDLAPWTIFDLDAYGSPWQEVQVLAARRRLLPGERVAVVLTDGAPRRAMLGLTAFALASLAGADAHAAGAHRRWTELVRAAMSEAARRMGGHLVALRVPEGGLGARGMFYGLAVLEGRQSAPAAAPGAAQPDGEPGAEGGGSGRQRGARGQGRLAAPTGQPEAAGAPPQAVRRRRRQPAG